MYVCNYTHIGGCTLNWEMLTARSMLAVINRVVMKVGGAEGIPETGKAKPFVTATGSLCSGRNFIIFLDRDSHRLIRMLRTKEEMQIGCVREFQGIFSFLGLNKIIFLKDELFRLLQSHGGREGNQGRRNLVDVSFWK